MADQQQLKRLLQGVKDWNTWRKQHPGIRPDLKGAHLEGAHLEGADLSEALLNRAHLSEAHLEGAHLIRAHLSEADFREAIVGETIFGNVDLRTVKGLETVHHWSPSTIGTDTLLRSE